MKKTWKCEGKGKLSISQSGPLCLILLSEFRLCGTKRDVEEFSVEQSDTWREFCPSKRGRILSVSEFFYVQRDEEESA